MGKRVLRRRNVRVAAVNFMRIVGLWNYISCAVSRLFIHVCVLVNCFSVKSQAPVLLLFLWVLVVV